MRFTLCCVVLFGVAGVPALSSEYYVSPGGDDGNPGTRERPFRTVQHAAEVMTAGDTCFLREGVYRETVTLKRGGRRGQPVRFAAYPGEVATLSGTEPVQGKWKVYRGRIYQTKVGGSFVQLFVDGAMMIEARWPNATFAQRLDRSRWAYARKGSRYGLLRDPALAETGVDWTGALATLNVTHQFFTWTRFVTHHEAGSPVFTYPKDFDKGTEMRYAKRTRPWEDDRYYLSGKLQALDAPTEWFLDRKTKTLYLWTADGGSPEGHKVEAKVRDYAVRAENVDYLSFEGINFFAATFSLRSCNHCVVDNCHLLFPTYTRELTELNAPPTRKNSPRTEMVGDYNVFRNSSLAYTPLGGVSMAGRQNTAANNLIHDVCWCGSLRYVALAMGPGRDSSAAPGGVVRGNTVFNCGNAVISYRGQPYQIAYNHVYNGGLACKDVALIYTGQPTCAGSVVHHNWVHGCRTETGGGLGIRGDDQTRRLTVHHNVVWDCGRDGIIVKGDFNRVANNTVLFIGTRTHRGNFIDLHTMPEPKKPWRKQYPLLKVQNANSELVNNAAQTLTGNIRGKPFPFAEHMANNYQGAELKLVDLNAWDFRPRRDSPLVDAGKVVPEFTAGFVGKAPDIGAYEYGGKNWKPGHHNGLWISAPARGRRMGGKTLRVALLLPPLKTITLSVLPSNPQVQVETGARLTFTPASWQVPQPVTYLNRQRTPAALRFAVEEWGEVELDLAGLEAPRGTRKWFPGPDLPTPVPPDQSFNTLDYSTSPGKTATVAPTARAFLTDGPVVVDGVLSPDEWRNWTPARSMFLRPLGAPPGQPAIGGEAYALFDAGNLYLALRMRRAPVAGADEWGLTDGVELDVQTTVNHRLGPVFVLHGFPSGRVDSVTDGGASRAQAAALLQAVRFKAAVGRTGWTAEFAVPFQALGGPPGQLERIRFNAGLRVGRGADGQWFAWADTGEANYAVEKAGELVLRPVCRVDAGNLLRGGDFEAADLSPWHAATNGRNVPPAMEVDRVPGGLAGSWCARLRCADAGLMKKGVLKWLHPLPAALEPGVFVLSYDLHTENLTPRGPGGMFCSYIRTRTADGGGRNEGQQESGVTTPDVDWTRRDCVIRVPTGAKPRFVSLQLHKATGTVWVDNVALYRAEPDPQNR